MLDLLRNFFGRLENATLAVTLVAGGAVWSFVAVASEMIEGDFDAFDQAVLLFFRNPQDLSDPIGPRAVEVAMRDLTALGGVTVLSLLTLSVLILLILRRHIRSAAVMAAAVLGGQLLSHGLKLTFDRPRPALVPHGVDVLTASFPSGHSMMAAVTYLTLAVMLARIESSLRVRAFYIVLALVLTFLVGLSRIYLGVHYPSDVLAGWAAGAGWALICALFAQWLAWRGRISPTKGQTP